MTDSPQRPKSTDRIKDMPKVVKPADGKKISPTESGNVKGGGKQTGVADDGV